MLNFDLENHPLGIMDTYLILTESQKQHYKEYLRDEPTTQVPSNKEAKSYQLLFFWVLFGRNSIAA